MLQQHRKSVAAVSYQRDDPSSATSPSQIVAESGSTFPSFTVDKGLRISGYANFEGSEQVLSMPSPLVEAIPTTSTSERDFEKGKVVDAGTIAVLFLPHNKRLKCEHSYGNLCYLPTHR